MVSENIRKQAAALELDAPIAIRVSPRARRIALRINAAERVVELVLPRGVAASQGLRFVHSKRGWITARKLTGGGGRWILWADDEELDRLRRLRASPRGWADQPYPPELTTPKAR